MAKSFEKWQTQEIEEVFGIAQNDNSVLLNNWLSSSYELSDNQRITLENLKQRLTKYANFFNEADLKTYFIDPLVNLVAFFDENYRAFYEHTFSAKKQTLKKETLTLRGRVEVVVAKGQQIARIPFFFLHEYKPATGATNDPQGQLLITMLAAQTLNQDDYPVYGCYIIGRNWFFVVLEGNEYAVSRAYDATQADIFHIYSILMETKKYIHQRLGLPFL